MSKLKRKKDRIRILERQVADGREEYEDLSGKYELLWNQHVELARLNKEIEQKLDCLRNALKSATAAGKLVALDLIKKARADFFNRAKWPGTAYAEVQV